MIAERVAHSGAWSVYGVVNGYLLSRTYYGCTKRDAVRLWRQEASARVRFTSRVPSARPWPL